MKKLLCLLLVFLFVPVFSFADPDPILGAWYIMFDYSEYPASPQTASKNYMIFIIVFEENGVISGISGESTDAAGLTASGSAIGTWKNENGSYTLNIVGVGSNSGEFSGDRLLVQMAPNVWYSMQRLNLGDWYTDLVIRY